MNVSFGPRPNGARITAGVGIARRAMSICVQWSHSQRPIWLTLIRIEVGYVFVDAAASVARCWLRRDRQPNQLDLIAEFVGHHTPARPNHLSARPSSMETMDIAEPSLPRSGPSLAKDLTDLSDFLKTVPASLPCQKNSTGPRGSRRDGYNLRPNAKNLPLANCFKDYFNRLPRWL